MKLEVWRVESRGQREGSESRAAANTHSQYALTWYVGSFLSVLVPSIE
jgi:cytochrome oxidase assembly protein ShyY1